MCMCLASFPGLPIFFAVWFALTVICGSERVPKLRKAWENSSRERHQVDAVGVGPMLSTAFGVFH